MSFPLVATLSLLPYVVAPQDPSAQPLVKSRTHVVLLDVVATDSAGKPVNNLKREDFVVMEDGAPQTISSFDAPVTNLSSGQMALPNSPRTIILLDELNINYTDLSFARDRTMQYLTENRRRHSPTAILAIRLHGLALIQDYTQDEAVLQEAVKQFKPVMNNPVEGTMDPGKVAEHANTSINALLEIARASAGSPYNLNVIWITGGFAGSLRETKNRDGRQNGLRRLANILTTARMRLYTIDPGGTKPLQATQTAAPINATPLGGKTYEGQSSTDSAMEESIGQGTSYEANHLLAILTAMTGGRAYYGRNDIEVALGQAVFDGTSNYAVSYAPVNGDFNGEYRKISIRSNVPGVTLRTRLGYYATEEETETEANLREAKWQAALVSPLTYSAFRLSCPMTYNQATANAKGVITVKPTPLAMQAPPQMIQIVRAASLSKNREILTGWAWQISGKQTWTNRVTNLNFEKDLPKKAKTVRFLVSDPAAEHIGTCDYQVP